MTNLITLIHAIAIWCGIPSQRTLLSGDVQVCRDRLMACAMTLSTNGNSVTMPNEGAVYQCFKKEKM